jgi:ADP-ribose pyrophosphatase YjhB (NUDIX family)
MYNYSWCSNKCCCIKKCTKLFITQKFKKNKNKSGVFLYDPIKKKLLLVQSRGNLWGPPKGTVSRNETYKKCAIREVNEETGLNIPIEELNNDIFIKHNVVYFYKELSECDVKLSLHTNNDVTGITWININCLKNMINNNSIKLTKHCKIILKKTLKLIL